MTEDAKMKLLNWTFEDKTAEEAVDLTLEALGEHIRYGFTFTRASAEFCVIRGGEKPGCLGWLFGKRGTPPALLQCSEQEELERLPLESAFELRLFGKNYEARWERMNAAKGRLTICADGGAVAETKGLKLDGWDAPAKRTVRHRDHCYLLWGESTDQPHTDRTKLTSARIGELWAPAERGAKRVVVTAREYFETQEFGNVVFIGERLTGFRAASGNDAS